MAKGEIWLSPLLCLWFSCHWGHCLQRSPITGSQHYTSPTRSLWGLGISIPRGGHQQEQHDEEAYIAVGVIHGHDDEENDKDEKFSTISYFNSRQGFGGLYDASKKPSHVSRRSDESSSIWLLGRSSPSSTLTTLSTPITSILASSSSYLPNNGPMAETLSMVCNVVVVCVDSNKSLSRTLLSHIRQGMKRRQKAGYPKLYLVLMTREDGMNSTITNASVPTLSGNNDDDHGWKQQILQELQDTMKLSSTDKNGDDDSMMALVESLDGNIQVWTWKELEEKWDEFMLNAWESSTTPTVTATTSPSTLVPSDGFASLLENIYQSISSKSLPVQLVPWTLILEDEATTRAGTVPKEETDLGHVIDEVNISYVLPDSTDNDNGNDMIQDQQQQLHQQILTEIQFRLDQLEEKQEDFWLGPDRDDDDDDTTLVIVPMLEFGKEANDILQYALDHLSHDRRSLLSESNDDDNHERDLLLSRVTTHLQRLYHQQLQLLREHYGRQYEAVLDKMSLENPSEQYNQQQEWTQAAARATESFRAAAQHAIPKLCQEGQELRDAADFSYISSLQGLISDMMEATRLRNEWNAATMASDDEDENDDDDDNDNVLQKKKPAKWYKKLAARAAVLGVNYLQGWLALQGIRKAAAERDRHMPKFPLF